jgi:hypothetical protein
LAGGVLKNRSFFAVPRGWRGFIPGLGQLPYRAKRAFSKSQAFAPKTIQALHD